MLTTKFKLFLSHICAFENGTLLEISKIRASNKKKEKEMAIFEVAGEY